MNPLNILCETNTIHVCPTSTIKRNAGVSCILLLIDPVGLLRLDMIFCCISLKMSAYT